MKTIAATKPVGMQTAVLAIVGTFALFSAFLLRFSNTYPFAFTDAEYLNLLFSHNFFHPANLCISSAGLPAVQNTNLLTVMVLNLAEFIPVDRFLLLWLGQTVLCVLLFLRSVGFLRNVLEKKDRSIYLLLFLSLPPLWKGLLFSPSQALAALLFIESFSRLTQKKFDAGWTVTLFLLSLSGLQGFFWAFLLGAAGIVFSLSENPPYKRNSPFSSCFYTTIAALMPVTILYLFLSLETGVLGGIRSIGFPTLFSELSLTTLLTGEWSAHVRYLLLWLGNGCNDFPVPFPLFGLFSLLGIFAWLHKKDENRFFVFTAIITLVISIALFAFAPVETSEGWFLPLLAIVLLTTVRGIRWTARHSQYERAISWSAAGLLASFSLISSPAGFSPIISQARYRSNVNNSLQQVLQNYPLAPGEIAAIDFDPCLFVRLPENTPIFPLELAIRNPLRFASARHEGIRFDQVKALALGPGLIVRYPSFKEVNHAAGNGIERGESTFAREILSSYYTKKTIHHLEVFTPAARPPPRRL